MGGYIVTTPVWRPEDNSVESVLFLHLVHPRCASWILATHTHLHLLSHLAGLRLFVNAPLDMSIFCYRRHLFKDGIPFTICAYFLLKKSNLVLLFLKFSSCYNPLTVRLFLSPTICMCEERYLPPCSQSRVWRCVPIISASARLGGKPQFKGSLGNTMRLRQKLNNHHNNTKKPTFTIIDSFIFAVLGLRPSFKSCFLCIF